MRPSILGSSRHNLSHYLRPEALGIRGLIEGTRDLRGLRTSRESRASKCFCHHEYPKPLRALTFRSFIMRALGYVVLLRSF